VKVELEHEKSTKNYEQFKASTRDGIFNVYLGKDALTQMSWKPGSTLIVTLENGR
jgi:hypothetical protein